MGEVDSQNAALEIKATFSQPMVALTDNKTMGQFCPIQLIPSVPGRCRWRGTNTLVFEPDQPLPPGHHYQVLIPKGTQSQVSGAVLDRDVRWQFDTLRLQVTNSMPRDHDQWIGLNPVLFCQFNLPVDAAVASKFARLTESPLDSNDPGEDIPLTVRPATNGELKKAGLYYLLRSNNFNQMETSSDETVIAFVPSRPLKPDHAYRLILGKDLPSKGGEVGLPADRTIYFETWYTFAFKDAPNVTGCLGGPDNYNFSLTNPVEGEELASHLTVTPALSMDQNRFIYGSRDGSRRKVFYSLASLEYQPATTYNFVLKAGLTDLFGNHLPQNVNFTFTTGDYCPWARMNEGFGVLESYLKHRLPVTVLNETGLPLKMGLVSEDQLIPLFHSLHWDEFNYSEDEGDEDLDDQENGEAMQQGRINSPQTSPKEVAFQVDRDWTPDVEKNKNCRSYLDLDEVLKKEGGVVYSQLSFGNRENRAVDDVTPLGITLKTSPDSSLGYVTFLKTGHSAKGIPLLVRGDANKVLWKGVTDKNGFVEFPGWRQLGITDWPAGRRPALWAFAEHKDGYAVISSSMQGGIDPWRFNVNWDPNPQSHVYKGMVFTERGVYRPGEKIYWKGIVRRLIGDDWTLSDLKVLNLKLTDPAGEEAFTASVTISSRGTFQSHFDIPADARTGEWNLHVSSPERSNFNIDSAVRVEAYKTASFEVHAKPQQDSYMDGDKYTAKIDGWYLFGAAMSGADYEAHLRLEPTSFQPPDWEEFEFNPPYSRDEDQEQGRGQPKEILNTQGKLNSDGTVEVSSALDGSGFRGPFQASLEASVISPDRQTLFARSSIMVHKSNLYIGLNSEKSFIEAGNDWKVKFVCVTPDGKPIQNVHLKAQLKRRQWISAEKTGQAGRLQWVSIEKITLEKEFDVTSSDKAQDLTVTPQATGEYFIVLTGADEKNRPAQSAIYCTVAGKGEAWWARQDDDIIELVPDKKEYKPGDVAKIMVKSPYGISQAMITTERETVLSHSTAILNGGADFITVPITEKSLPNIYVSVMLVQGRGDKPQYDDDGLDLAKPQAKFGYVNLNVNPGGRHLAVKIKTDQPDYQPRQPVKVNLQVLDDSGKPAPGEVAVFVVDEGVLSLTGFETPQPFEFFYGPRPLQIVTSDSRLWVIGQRSFGEKGKEHGGGGGGGFLAGIDLRSNFVPTAYYNPGVVTDENGHASVSFTLPDNLSRFRVMAVAVADKKFGNGESRLTVSKHLVLRPSLPRFSRVGDDFEGGVVVHNDGHKPAEVTLDMKIDGSVIKVDESESNTRKINLNPGEEQEILFHCHSEKLGNAVFSFRALSSENDTDGLQWTIPVEVPEHLETVATSGATSDNAVEKLALPAGSLKNLGGVKLSYSSTALAGLQGGAAYLLDYPYGCLEQRLSKSLPVIVGSDLLETFGLGKMDDLKTSVQDVIDHLADFQCSDGGFRYWVDAYGPDPYLTAYALDVVYQAKKEGYTIPQEVMDKAVTWMNNYLSTQKQWAYPYSESDDYAARAYTVYALSLWGQKPTSYFTNLYTRRDQIPFLAKAYLLKAAPRLMEKSDITQTLGQELLNQARVEPRSIHFEEPAETRPMWWVHGSTVKTTALCLQALLDTQGGFANDEKVVKWLTGERKDKGRWRNTQENASVLWALQDYYRHYEKDTPNFTASLTTERADGEKKTIWSQTFEGRSLQAVIKDMALDEVFAQGETTAQMDISKEGTGRLYYDMTMSYMAAFFTEPDSEGYDVTRTVKWLKGDGEHFKAGARAVVTLKVSTKQDHTFVALTDQLPGGFEIVDPSYAVEGADQLKAIPADQEWGQYWGSFQRNEKYDDRIQIFADFLSAGEHSYSYLIQATTPGTFNVPSTWIESMYEPEVFGRTATGSVTIEK